MSKIKVVAFKNGQAKILMFKDESLIIKGEGVHINPDLSAVKGLSPELWAEDIDGKIVPNTNKRILKQKIIKKASHIILGEAVLKTKKLQKMLAISIAVNIITGLILILK